MEKEIAPTGQAISYSYDENGNLTSITPPGQPAHEFGYDNRNLGTSYNAPQVGTEDRTTSNEYDLDRLPTSLTLPGGGKIEYGYDEGGRPKTLRYPGGERTYTYNAQTGNLSTVSNASGSLSYAFDGFLPLAETSTGQVPGRVNFSYDNDLRVKGVSVNGGPEAAYSYDKDGLITKAGALDLSRDQTRGLLTGTTLSNVTDTRAFNSFGEMESYEALSGSNRLYQSTYKLDSLGRIVEKTETIGGNSTTFAYTYDEEGNLKEVKQNGEVVASYAYDPNGNRLSQITPSGTTEGSYDAQDRLISYGGNEYAYTPDGQLKTKTDTSTGKVTSYDYDALGNLLSVTLPEGKEVEYVVDAADRRVGKKVDGQLVQGFLYLGQLAPVAELDGSGNVVSRFVYGTKENVPDYMEKNGKTYRMITDQVGSVRLVVDAATGEVAQRIDYDEFGNVLEDTNPGFQPFGFAGGLYDPDTRLTRFGARDYDAETGRWTTKDPIGFLGGDSNLYAYVMNDPINFVDSDGLDPDIHKIPDPGANPNAWTKGVQRRIGDLYRTWRNYPGHDQQIIEQMNRWHKALDKAWRSQNWSLYDRLMKARNKVAQALESSYKASTRIAVFERLDLFEKARDIANRCGAPIEVMVRPCAYGVNDTGLFGQVCRALKGDYYDPNDPA